MFLEPVNFTDVYFATLARAKFQRLCRGAPQLLIISNR